MVTGSLFPTGKFTYTVGEHSPVVDIAEHGKMTLSLNGDIIVIAEYLVRGNILEVIDLEGSYASPEYGVGRYTWKLAGETLTFTLIEDKLPSRPKSFAVPWHRVESAGMPNIVEREQV